MKTPSPVRAQQDAPHTTVIAGFDERYVWDCLDVMPFQGVDRSGGDLIPRALPWAVMFRPFRPTKRWAIVKRPSGTNARRDVGKDRSYSPRTGAPADPALALGALNAPHRIIGHFTGAWALTVISFGFFSSAIMAVPPRITDRKANEMIAGLGTNFRQERSDHFILAYDTSDRAAREVSMQLEATYGAVLEFCRQTGIAFNRPAAPLTTVLFNRRERYREYLRDRRLRISESAGSFLPTAGVAVFWNIHDHPEIRRITEQIDKLAGETSDSGRQRGGHPGERIGIITALRAERDSLVGDFNGLVVAHETAHQVLYNVGARVLGSDGPTWLVEGLACQFEIPQPRLADGLITANPRRQSDYRTALGVESKARVITMSQYREAIRSGRIVPLSELLVADDLFTDDEERSAYRYAQSWALVFYLYRAHGNQFKGFLQTLVARSPTGADDAAALFEASFGPVDNQWEANMASVVLAAADQASGP